MKMSFEEYIKLDPAQKANELAAAAEFAAGRCRENYITRGGWIDKTMEGMAQRLRELAHELEQKRAA